MSQIKLEHLGYEIQFSEDPEEWQCHDLNMRAKTLKALKAKMSKQDAAARKVSVPCAFFEGYYSSKPTRGEVVLIAKASEQEWETRQVAPFKRERVSLPTVWIMAAKRDGGNSRERRKMRVDSLLDLTDPTTEDLLRECQDLDRQSRELAERAKAVREKIPRMSIEQIKATGVIEDGDAD